MTPPVLGRRSLTVALSLVMLCGIQLARPATALACENYPAANSGTAYRVGQQALPENYRGIHGAISWTNYPGTNPYPPNPDPNHNPATKYHINVVMGAKHDAGGLNQYWSQIGWAMGYAQSYAGGVHDEWLDAPTVLFEAVDTISTYRATYGTVGATSGTYEVSEGGQIGGYWKYIGWYNKGAGWFQSGYAELTTQYTQEDVWGEAVDTGVATPCLKLTWVTGRTNPAHEMGSPSALLLLTDIWHDWTAAYPSYALPDNTATTFYGFRSYANDHVEVWGSH